MPRNGKQLMALLNVIFVTGLLCFLSIGCVKPANQPISQISAFGSQYAGKFALEAARSDFVPLRLLERPGILDGHWVSSTETHQLNISEDFKITENGEAASSRPGCQGFPRDCFLISLPGTDIRPKPFYAAYESFVVYGVDVTGDGVEELVIESGKGRGTSVYVRSLRVYKLFGKEFWPIFEAPLNGYLYQSMEPQKDGYNPPSWERSYIFKRNTMRKTFDIILDLLPPRDDLKAVAKLNDLFLVQSSKIVACYDQEHESYFIDKVSFSPLK
jgi:hypothetical protein